jgi:predicted MFS family arabinose efflux permease
VFGGLLTELGWRWTFLLPVPIALALLVAAPRVLAKDAPAEGPRRGFDFAGAATITAAMLLLVRTVVEAPDTGWGAVETLAGFAVTALLLAAFVAIEQRSAHPLVRLGILRSGSLVRANLGMAAVFGAYVAFQFIGTLYLQRMLGWSPVETALAFLPGGLLVAFGAPRIGPLVDRFGTARIILVGAISFVVGYVLFLRIGESLTYATVFLPSMILIGLGFALSFPTLNIQATAGVPNHEQGLASGLVNTSFQVGGAIGLAIVTAVVSSNTSGTDGASMLDGFQAGIAVVAAIAALGLAVAAAGVLRESRERAVSAVEAVPEREAA